eukprot:COSAG05_NODE_1504_length_4692_cov_2.598737_3_plen_53_part_00
MRVSFAGRPQIRRAATTEKAFIVRDAVSDRQKLRTLGTAAILGSEVVDKDRC